MVYVYLVVVGLCFGSFVNALIWRLHGQMAIAEKQEQGKPLTKADKARLKQLSISTGRSKCLACGHELAVRDLVPVLSWVWLRGKCRYCGTRFPDTPVAELLVPLLFVVSYLFWPHDLNTIQSIVLFAIWLGCLVAFAALALYDLRWFLLPDRVVFPLIGLAVLFVVLRIAGTPHNVGGLAGGAALGILAVAGIFYGLYQLSGGQWIGFGDVKLAIALGLLAGSGLNGLVLILFASVTGLLASLPSLLTHKLGTTSKIPFGPFLLLAAFVVVLWGQAIGDWYLHSFVY